MKIEDLTNKVLTERIEILRSKERAITLQFLIHLSEFDKRRLYLEQGYSSLFDFCTRKLGYSEGSAYRRIESARCIREYPELRTSFLKGEVSLCTIAIAARAIKAQKTEVKEILGKSAREVGALIAKVAPSTKPRECVKEIKVIKETPELPLKEQTETRYEIKFSVSKEVYDEMQAIKAKLSNKIGSSLSLESVFIELVNKFKTTTKERKVNSLNENSRYVPVSVKREVTARDKCQCSYVSPSGVRCAEKHYLQIDHIKPFGIGGKTNSSNLRLLCANHNQMLARRTFGENNFRQELRR